MRVNSAIGSLLCAAGFSGCVIGVTPVIQYGPLTVEMSPGGANVGPPTPTPPPAQPQLLSIVGSTGQDSLALIMYFPSDVYDYVVLTCAVTPLGSPPSPQKMDVLARSGTTHSIIYDLNKPVVAGRYFAQLTYAKGRL